MHDDDAKQAPEPTGEPKSAGERITLELAGSPVTLTRTDAQAIRAALIARLEESALPAREQLIMRAKSPPIAFEKDTISIGTWGLAATGSELTLTERMGPGSAEAYQAEVTREDGQFRVGEVRPLFIHPRR